MTDPALLAKMMSDYGPYGLLTIALLTIRWIFGKYEAAQQARIDDGRLYAAALKDAAKALEKSNEVSVDLASQVSELKLMLEHRRGRA